MKKLILILMPIVAALAVNAAQPPSVGAYATEITTNLTAAAVQAPIGVWPVAKVYNVRSALVSGGTIGLYWTAPTNSLGAREAEGFNLYWGDINVAATNKWNVGTNQSAAFFKLNTNITYFFFCTARLTNAESLPSELIVYRPLP